MNKCRKKRKKEDFSSGFFQYRESSSRPGGFGSRPGEKVPKIWRKRLFFAGCMECYPGDQE